jgi:hypothetical protein
MDETGLIETYLDELLDALNVEPRRARRILAETEDHLREAVARREEAGMAPTDAARAAIGNFGSAREIAGRFNAMAGSVPLRQWAPRLWAWLLLLASVGMLAVGLAGEVTVGLGLAFGKQYVTGDIIGITYTSGRCADFLSYHPEAADCEAAATAHHFDEVWQNADLALAGGLATGAFAWWWRRRVCAGERQRALGRSAFRVLGMGAFGAAGPLLVLYGAMVALAYGGVGSLQFIVGGVVAMACFGLFAKSGWRELRQLAAERG